MTKQEIKQLLLDEMSMLKGVEKVYALQTMLDREFYDEEATTQTYCETICKTNAVETPTYVTEREMIAFANYVLEDRNSKLFQINPNFTGGVLDLNPNFFTITDADVQNFKHDTEI